MSNFGSYHPGVLFLYYMMVLLFAMFSVQPVVLVCILAGGIFFFFFFFFVRCGNWRGTWLTIFFCFCCWRW